MTAKNKIKHSLHPGHELTQIYTQRKYYCDGCKILGRDMRFRCNDCDFDLHAFCAMCPNSMPSAAVHPLHQLNLVNNRPAAQGGGPINLHRKCDICNESIRGLQYRCDLCDFDVHPICSLQPLPSPPPPPRPPWLQ